MTCVGLEVLAAFSTAGRFINIDCVLYLARRPGTVLRALCPALCESSDVIQLDYLVTVNKKAETTGSAVNRLYFESRTWRRRSFVHYAISWKYSDFLGVGPTGRVQSWLTGVCGLLGTEFGYRQVQLELLMGRACRAVIL